jgi:hypothetical protein
LEKRRRHGCFPAPCPGDRQSRTQADAPARQRPTEEVAAAFQAALERPQRTTESLGRLVPRQSFQVTQHQWLAALIGQALHFLIEDAQ